MHASPAPQHDAIVSVAHATHMQGCRGARLKGGYVWAEACRHLRLALQLLLVRAQQLRLLAQALQAAHMPPELALAAEDLLCFCRSCQTKKGVLKVGQQRLDLYESSSVK
jgi:hypothetical protein